MIADWAKALRPQAASGPTTGGLLISYEVARHLGRAASSRRRTRRLAARFSAGLRSPRANECSWSTTC